MKNLIASLITIGLALSLCACTPSGQSKESPKADETDTSEIHYTLDSLSLPEGMASATAQCISGNKIFLGGLSKDDVPLLGYVTPDGETGFLEMPEVVEYVHAMCVAGEKLTVLAGSHPNLSDEAFFSDDPSQVPDPFFLLLTYSLEGEKLSEVSLIVGSKEQIYSYDNIEGDSTGGFIALSPSNVVHFSSEGSVLNNMKITSANIVTSLCIWNGNPIFSSFNPSKNQSTLHSLDSKTFDVEAFNTIDGEYVFGLGIDTEGQLLINTGNGVRTQLLSLASSEEEPELLINWNDIGIADQRYSSLTGTNAETILLFERNQDALYFLKKSEGPDTRTELRLATDTAMPDLTGIINAFNRKNTDYRVTLSVWGATPESSFELLKTEIIAGDAPDIFAFFHPESMQGTERNGVFEDLSPLLDSGGELGRDDFVPSLIKAMEDSGKLYWLPWAFAVTTCHGSSEIFDHPGITPEEFEKARENTTADIASFPSYITKEGLLNWYGQVITEDYLDMEKGSCSFDSPDFIRFLELCNDRPDNLNGGDPNAPSLLTIEQLQNPFRLWALREYFGDFVFTGFPTEHSNGSMFTPFLRFAMSSHSENKEGVWQFISFAFSEENLPGTDSTHLPAIQSALDKNCAEMLENGADTHSGRHVEFDKRDMDKMFELIESTTRVEGRHSPVMGIIEEEASKLFAGDCTARECARLIQERASLYVAEQS